MDSPVSPYLSDTSDMDYEVIVEGPPPGWDVRAYTAEMEEGKMPLWWAAKGGHEGVARLLLEREQCSQPSSPSVFLGVLGRTTSGRVRTGRTIGDYSPCAWTFGTCQVEIMRHHSCGPPQSPAVPCSLPSPYTPYYSGITHNLKPFFRVPKQSLSGLLHILL